MHRIDGPGATANNAFTEGDPVSAVPATVVTDDWLNAVQEEISSVITSAGIDLDKEVNNQLLAAITAKITAAIPAAPPAASTTVSGIVELATATETQNGADTARAVTPSGLASLTATTGRSGLVELATDTEVQAGADTQRAVTPAGLKIAYGLGDSSLVADLNNAATGYFYASPGATNSPGSGIVFGETRTGNGTTAKSQSCIDISTRAIYKRTYTGGAWSAWTSVIDSATLATETVTGVAKVATQALTNAGVDDATIVTPKKLKAAFPAGSRVKAWCNFNGTGTPAIRSASGFSSVIDNGVGDYTLMFTTPESDANFAVVASGTTSSAPITGISCVGVYARSATSVSLSTSASASSRTDFANIDVAVFSVN